MCIHSPTSFSGPSPPPSLSNRLLGLGVWVVRGVRSLGHYGSVCRAGRRADGAGRHLLGPFLFPSLAPGVG
eukprot:7729855-Alexandrium_andersonii.AAC.1